MRKPRAVLPVPLLLLVLLVAPGPAAASECGDVPGLDPLLEPGAVLLVGEMHGTEQAPAFVREVTCAALAAGLPVTVGLEVDRGDDETYQAYLGSDGSPAARERLLAAPFWNREFQDGRGSVAMLELMEALRVLRASSGDGRLRLTLIDRPEAGAGRDEAMAERVAEAMAARGCRFFGGTFDTEDRLVRLTAFPEIDDPGLAAEAGRRIAEVAHADRGRR
ncbi:MAG TPA: hypothetical protein VF150_07255 [Thermoanaerobaculia bacterium]